MNSLQPIIPAVPVSAIERELSQGRFLCRTNRAGNDIYVVDAHNSPCTMREIGRLREISFRCAGGGTGKDCDIDEFDTMEPACQQLLVWNPQEREIIGAYRYIIGSNIRLDESGAPRIAMSHMFKFSKDFLEKYLPSTIELGRSFVRPEYQATKTGAKALFALDNLWDGLGALTVKHPEVKFLFGKMTMYPNYDRECRDLLLCFLKLYFPDPDRLATPIEPLATADLDTMAKQYFSGDDFRADYLTLNCFIRAKGITIPPLVNAYMSLSPTMKMLGTAINHEFGDVEETGILINIDEITEKKKSRHIDTYRK